MGGDQRRAALGQMGFHRIGKARDILGIKRNGGFIQTPDRPPRDQKARKAQAAFLARAHFARAPCQQRGKVKSRDRLIDGTGAKHLGPEPQIRFDAKL